MTTEETKSIEERALKFVADEWEVSTNAINLKCTPVKDRYQGFIAGITSEQELLKSQLEQKDKEIADRDELLKDMADYLDDWVAGFEDLDLHDIQNWVTRLLTRYNSLIKKVDSMEQQSGKSEEGCHDKCTGPWDCTCQDMLNAYYGKKPKRD